MAMKEVDPYRFTGRYIKNVISDAIARATPPPDLPWTTLSRPINESRIALLATAGISMRDDVPFDMDGERANPVWGAPTWRRIAGDATSADITVNHLHIDTSYIERHIKVALPTERLAELAAAGIVGDSVQALLKRASDPRGAATKCVRFAPISRQSVEQRLRPKWAAGSMGHCNTLS
jgi:hypothetical protein